MSSDPSTDPNTTTPTTPVVEPAPAPQNTETVLTDSQPPTPAPVETPPPMGTPDRPAAEGIPAQPTPLASPPSPDATPAPADPTPRYVPPGAGPVVDDTPAEVVEAKKMAAAQNPEAVEQPMPKTSVFGQMPEGDQEWVYTGKIQDAPEWVDRGWAAFDKGQPALAIPVVLDQHTPPYTTQYAYKGDTIRYKASKIPGRLGKFTVVPKPPEDLET